MYKALLTDVDGTLIQNKVDGLPSAKVKQAIAKAQKLIHIGIATSRPLFFVQHVLDAIQFSGPCIVSGGSQIYDATTKKIIWNKPLELADLWAILEILKSAPECEKILITEGEAKSDTFLTPSYQPHIPLGVCVKALDEELADQLVNKISNISNVTAHKLSSHTPGKVDINAIHAQATKQHAVLQVAELMKIDPKEIIGVGDGYNDFPLLMACGLRIAMGNAVDELKAIADFIAPSVDDDGLATVIEKFVLPQHNQP